MVGGILNGQLSIPISARVRQCHGPSIPATTLPFSNQVCRARARAGPGMMRKELEPDLLNAAAAAAAFEKFSRCTK